MLRDMLEEPDDMAEIARVRAEQEETFAWEDVLAEYQQVHGLATDVQITIHEFNNSQINYCFPFIPFETHPLSTPFHKQQAVVIAGLEGRLVWSRWHNLWHNPAYGFI